MFCNSFPLKQGGREILESLGYTEYTGFALQVVAIYNALSISFFAV
jgi:hypothetical protein